MYIQPRLSSSVTVMKSHRPDLASRRRRRANLLGRPSKTRGECFRHFLISQDHVSSTTRPYAPTRLKITRPECGLQFLFFRLLSVGLTDSSDSDGIEVVGVSTSRGNQTQKRRRQRSRSKSITPPPALPFHHIQNARNVVRLASKSHFPPNIGLIYYLARLLTTHLAPHLRYSISTTRGKPSSPIPNSRV